MSNSNKVLKIKIKKNAVTPASHNAQNEKPLGNVISFETVASVAKNSTMLSTQEDYILDSRGNIVDDVANAISFISKHGVLSNAFQLNLMTNTIYVIKPLSESKSSGTKEYPRELTEEDNVFTQALMNKGGLKKISKQTVYDAIAMNAGYHAVHPLRDELTKLIWDKTPRLGKWLSTYMGTPDDPYHRGIGQMFLIAAVARIMEPGCKVDYILVLEGKQGVGKSSVCAIIGGEYFSDSLPNLSTGKEASQHLAGRWIIELSELAATSKAETEQLKAFTTRRCEKYRPPYARTEVVQPRQCVFIGTTNKSAYLRDETGARRFWPVKVGTVDLNALTTDRDQLLAEAMALYDAGEDWFPDREFETKFIMPQQRERFEEDVWEEPVREYLIQLDPKIAYVGDILTQGLHVETQKHNRADQNRVTAILLNLGWGRLKKDSKGNQPWGPEKLVHQ